MIRPFARPLTAALTCLSIMLAASACNADPELQETEGISQRSLLEEAKNDKRVDPSQITMLEASSLDYGAYETAMNNAFQCGKEHGVEIQGVTPVTKQGNTRLTYGVSPGQSGLSSEAASEAFNTCYEKYAMYVDQYWQLAEPATAAWQARRDAELKGPLLACLQGLGQDVAEDAAFTELMGRASIIAEEDNSETDCIAQIGYFEWDG